MKIEILGCYGNVIGNHRATAFCINDSLLIDAGTVTEVLDDSRITLIENVIVSHTHIDHVKGIFPLVDELVMMNGKGIKVFSAARVLEIISKNLFNNLLWPDFTIIPSVNNAMIKLNEIGLEKEASLGGITVKPVLVTHTVYTVGYVIREGGRGFMFTSDTGPTKRFWEVAREEKGIEFIIADVSYPSRLENFAKTSGHMTLSILMEQIDKFKLGSMPIYINHLKPYVSKEILDELRSTGRSNIKLLEQGSTITV
jgi:ribonuclease BN (tRNA processing enzyme)